MNSRALIQILHLSDIQYGRHHVDKDGRQPLYPDADYSPQLERLIDDLEILKSKENVVPNFIVVTGDIAEWSLRDEYKAAGEFLGGLVDYLKIDRRYVILVPGNHDINRNLCQAARLTAEAEQESFNPPYFSKFKFYKEFSDEFYKDVTFPKQAMPYRFMEDRLFVNFFFPEEGVVFLGLNSCVDECELDPHYGNITMDQLKKAIGELNAMDPDAKLLRIALMHHNFVRSSDQDEENLKDADDLKPRLMANNIQLILHGHQHMPREEVTGKGDHVIHILATGSAGLDGNALPETPRRYQIIDMDRRTVRVYRRFFDKTHPGSSGKGCWKPDVAPDQSAIFDSFTISGLPGKVPEKAQGESNVTYEVPLELEIPEAYRQWVFEKCGHMDVDKLRDKGSAITVSLPEVFIPLYANPPGGSKADEIKDPEILMRDRVHSEDIEALIAEDGDLLISGEAGSGKTTLVKHFVLMSMKEPGWKGLDGVLPVLVFLKDLHGFDAAHVNHGPETAEALLHQSFRKSGCGLDVETVKNYCAAAKALFLLDGLDEISVALRNLVVNAFSAFRRQCKGGRFILSGRPHGLEGDVVDFIKDRQVSILPLAMDQVKTFITGWFQHVERSRSALVQRTAEGMISDIKSQPGVERLIHNPLMLTAVCILYYDEKELPGQRAELYKKFVDNMLHRRFPDPEPVHNFLMTLSHHMHTSPKKLKGIDKGPAIEILKTAYPQGDRSDDEYNGYIRKEFERIEPDCGLLKFDGGQLMFRHLTFQEFLTAAYIKDRNTRYDEAIRKYWQDEWYNEVVELLVGLLSIDSRQWANDIVEDGLKLDEEPPFHRWRLGARSITDIHEDRRYAYVVDLTSERMLTVMGSKADAKDRADAGEILGWLGDPRDLKGFIAIPSGTYELSIGACEIEPFEISKYPVTNRWYAKFIENGGYESKDLWPPEGLKWLSHTQTKSPMFWHDRKWNCPNHPVVGVCWYEADAFCRWLTENRNDGFTYRLPTEQQWEATAAGFKKRGYPWGNDFDKNRCNTEDSGIKQTSAAGVFKGGQTPEGISDLSGNVWEWTSTDYGKKTRLADCEFDMNAQELYEEIISTTGERRQNLIDKYISLVDEKNRPRPALRGGSWGGARGGARCGGRGRGSPLARSSDVGFRCSRTKD